MEKVTDDVHRSTVLNKNPNNTDPKVKEAQVDFIVIKWEYPV